MSKDQYTLHNNQQNTLQALNLGQKLVRLTPNDTNRKLFHIRFEWIYTEIWSVLYSSYFGPIRPTFYPKYDDHELLESATWIVSPCLSQVSVRKQTGLCHWHICLAHQYSRHRWHTSTKVWFEQNGNSWLGMSGDAQNRVTFAPNRINRGLFKISFITIWLEYILYRRDKMY